jgi:hypothetical protein
MDASYSILLKLVSALLLGTAIGIERHLKQRNSSLVTHALVASAPHHMHRYPARWAWISIFAWEPKSFPASDFLVLD